MYEAAIITRSLTGVSSIAWKSIISFLQIPTLITKSVTEESLTCGIAIPLPIAVDINSSRLIISTESSDAFFTCGAVARLFANSTRASLFVE